MKSKKTRNESPPNDAKRARPQADLNQTMLLRHLQVGWWGLFAFMAMGLALEAMHGLKLGYYLDVRNEVRHTMWTLCHAHGALLSLVNIAFALTLRSQVLRNPPPLASFGLIVGWLLMPLGFFLGGLSHHGGDPGIGILLVPVGGLVLLVAIFQAAWQLRVE